jgi:hypothetical protein
MSNGQESGRYEFESCWVSNPKVSILICSLFPEYLFLKITFYMCILTVQREFIVIFPYMHIMYLDQINTLCY